MKIGPFEFGKGSDDKSSEIVPAGSAEISFSGSEDDLDLSLYDVVEVDPDSVGGRDLFDSLMPLAANIAEATAQYDHAIVKFPNGIGWNDLLNRKTPVGSSSSSAVASGRTASSTPRPPSSRSRFPLPPSRTLPSRLLRSRSARRT